MNPINRRPASRLALALGLASGAWLALSATTAGIEPLAPHGAATAAAEADRIRIAQAETPPEPNRVTYTSEQADRGEDRFERDCEECHGDDLKGGLNGGPPLRGLAFEEKYANGAPASAMFLFMSTLMPPNSPGRYSASIYADLMAFILKGNGFQEGAPLPEDLDALDLLVMEK